MCYFALCTFPGILSSYPWVNLQLWYCWGCTAVRCCQTSVLWAFGFYLSKAAPTKSRPGRAAFSDRPKVVAATFVTRRLIQVQRKASSFLDSSHACLCFPGCQDHDILHYCLQDTRVAWIWNNHSGGSDVRTSSVLRLWVGGVDLFQSGAHDCLLFWLSCTWRTWWHADPSFFWSHGGTGLCKELPPLSASWAVVSCTIHACCPHRCSCSLWGKAQAALPFPKLVLWNQLYCFQAGLGQDCQELHHSAPLWSTCLWRPLTALIGVVAGPQVVVLRVPRDAATGKPHALAEILEQGGVSSILSFAWKQGLELCLQTM